MKLEQRLVDIEKRVAELEAKPAQPINVKSLVIRIAEMIKKGERKPNIKY